MREIKKVLDYPRIRRRLKSDHREIEEYLLTLQLLSSMVDPRTEVDIIKVDPTDNEYLACAKEARADYIVTGDLHLLDLKAFEHIQIVTPRQFVGVIESAGSA